MRTIALNKKYTHKCLVGDFNLPSINWENWTTPHNEESKEERFLDALRDSFLHQGVKEPTRCRGNDEPSTIDLILTGEENQINDLQYLSPLGKSDHSVLYFHLQCYTDKKSKTKRFVYDRADYVSMKQYARTLDWVPNVQTVDERLIETIWKHFKSNIMYLRDKFVPLKDTGQFLRKKWKRQ